MINAYEIKNGKYCFLQHKMESTFLPKNNRGGKLNKKILQKIKFHEKIKNAIKIMEESIFEN
jgi:hypothetical protein